MPITIYDLPESVNSEYARRQEAYDKEVAAGNITPAGIVEAAAYQAARVRVMEPQPSQLDALLGLNVQSQIAHFVQMPGAEVLRNFSVLGTPSLGSVPMREAYVGRIQDVLEALPPRDRAENERGALALTAAISQTIEYDNERDYILGQMGSLRAG